MDEISLRTVLGKNSKLFTKKNRKQIARIIFAESGNSITAVICMSAGANFIEVQPLNMSLIFPLNTYYNQPLEKKTRNSPCKEVVTVFQISKIVCESYVKVCTPLNAINRFYKKGTFPYDSAVFSETNFPCSSNNRNTT